MSSSPFDQSRINPFASPTSEEEEEVPPSFSPEASSLDFSARTTAMDGGSYRDPFEEDEDRDLTDEEKDAFDREGLHRSYPLTTLSRSHPTGPSYRHPSQAPPASRYVQSDASAPSLSRAPSEIGSVMSNGRSASRGYANSIRSGRTAAGKSFLSMRSSATTNRKAFVSTKLKGEVYKPWLERPDPAHRWARAIIIGSMVIGAAIAGLLAWSGYNAVPHVGKLCLVMEDSFDQFDTSRWQRQVQVGGYGNGEFDWTTDSPSNSFVEDNTLYIVPTLTTDVLSKEDITNGYTLDLSSTCTASNVTGPNCIMTSNSSMGVILPPVQSARLSTKLSHSIRYGKVELEARMPTGDWTWPAIWMLPTENYYGQWPLSGEIDILEGRGNGQSYGYHGVDYISSALHWGPFKSLDRYYWTWGWNQQRRRYYNEGFHTYGFEWTPEYLMTYVDSRVNTIVHVDFKKKNFFKRGNFPSVVDNGTAQITLTNPWAKSANNSAPFDRPFYLIMNVAVGGTNGWFPDGISSKPWVDSAPTAVADFWNASSSWVTTWPEDHKKRGMAIRNFKMWQKC